MDRLPSVTAVIPAYNAEAFVEAAIRSALEQDYPPKALSVVVVDDGSTDRTGAIVERLKAWADGRLLLIRQDNRGLVGAVNRGVAAARGELIALLDADDVWPADKIRRQVEVLRARPEVGLVYTDMRVIDAEGRVLDESWLAGAHAPQGREVGALLEENRVTASSIVVRAALREHLFPIPAEMPWADWWLAVRTALVADVAYLDEPKTLYRFHGANMSLGTQGARRLRELRGALGVQRWFLRRLTPEQASVAELERAWDAFQRMASEALSAAGSPFAPLVEVSEEDRQEAASLHAEAARLLAAGDRDAAVALAIRAAVANPACDDVRALLLRARAAAPLSRGRDPLRDANGTVVRLPLDELLRTPAMLGACAEHLHDVPDLTLAIDATEIDAGAAAQQVQELLQEAGDDVTAGLDLLLVTGPLDALGQARLRHGVAAQITAVSGLDGAPAYAPSDLAALRTALAAGVTA